MHPQPPIDTPALRRKRPAARTISSPRGRHIPHSIGVGTSRANGVAHPGPLSRPVRPAPQPESGTPSAPTAPGASRTPTVLGTSSASSRPRTSPSPAPTRARGAPPTPPTRVRHAPVSGRASPPGPRRGRPRFTWARGAPEDPALPVGHLASRTGRRGAAAAGEATAAPDLCSNHAVSPRGTFRRSTHIAPLVRAETTSPRATERRAAERARGRPLPGPASRRLLPKRRTSLSSPASPPRTARARRPRSRR